MTSRAGWMMLGVLLCGASAISAQDCAAGTRPFDHVLGTSCIPDDPQRVVALDTTIIELLLLTGRQPAAVSDIVLDAGLRMHPELEATYQALKDAVPDYGFPPNLEVILDAQPDLIIAPSDLVGEAVYGQLAAVIPTIVYDPVPGEWRPQFELAADALNLRDEAAALLEAYDARVAELESVLEPTRTLSLVRAFPGQIGLLLPGTFGAQLVDALGIPRPESQQLDYTWVLEQNDGRPELLIQAEMLSLASGDVIFVFGEPAELEALPLWGALPAVAGGNAFNVGYYWWGSSLLSAHDMLDDLFAHYVGVESTLPNPFETGLTPDAEATPEATPAD